MAFSFTLKKMARPLTSTVLSAYICLHSHSKEAMHYGKKRKREIEGEREREKERGEEGRHCEDLVSHIRANDRQTKPQTTENVVIIHAGQDMCMYVWSRER